jgi:hypothetical protein
MTQRYEICALQYNNSWYPCLWLSLPSLFVCPDFLFLCFFAYFFCYVPITKAYTRITSYNVNCLVQSLNFTISVNDEASASLKQTRDEHTPQ